MDDLRKSSKLQIGLMSVIFVSLMIVVPITGYFHDLGGSSQFKSGSATYNQTNRTFTANFDGLFLKTVATFIDPTTYAFKIHIEVEPSGSFKTSDDLERLAEPIRLFVNGRPTIFPAGQPTSPQDLSLTFSTGDPNRYPFESFGDSVRIHAQRDVSSTLSTPIPLALSFTGYLQGWSITSTAENVGLRDVKLQIQFARSATVKFFSLFVIGLMWILSLTMLTLSVTLWIRKRRVEPPTMAVAAALLFALPAIRNTQVNSFLAMFFSR